MKIGFFGHAAVGLTTTTAGRILIDPYLPGAFAGKISYGPIPGRWDRVLISHDHDDHNHVAPSFGKPEVVMGPCRVPGLEIAVFQSGHGTNAGTVKAVTRIFRLKVDDLTIVHPGDLGPGYSADLVANLRDPDLLFVPVGGRFTLDAPEAWELVKQLAPRVVVPMHYKTAGVGFPLDPLEPFLDRFDSIRRCGREEVELHTGLLPARTQLWHLPPICLG